MILTLTVSSVLLIGRAQPIPARVAALHLGDICALPCWIGITPGKTSVAQAKQIVVQVYGQAQVAADGTTAQMVTLPNGEYFAVEFNTTGPDEPLVQNLVISLSPAAIQVSDVMNSVGRIRLLIPYAELLVQAQGIDLLVSYYAMGMDFDLELTSNVEALSIPSDPAVPDHTYYAHWMGLGNYHVVSDNGNFIISHVP